MKKADARKRIRNLPSQGSLDSRTGEPIVWFSKNTGGSIELFDLMGFHPITGEELLPITRDVVETWKQANLSCAVQDNGLIRLNTNSSIRILERFARGIGAAAKEIMSFTTVPVFIHGLASHISQ